MFFDSIQIAEGGAISNMVVASGTSFPAQANPGELFFHTSDNKMYLYNGASWVSMADTSSVVTSVASRTGAITLMTTDIGGLATVASSGSYDDLTNKPTIPVVTGTNTGDQTITLTGDVTGSGTGSFSATLATVNGAPVSAAFQKITVNGKGLVTATSAVTPTDITTALGYTPASLSGATFTGSVLLSADPTQALGAVTKQYVDNVASGLNVHNAVVTATTAALTATYSNGTDGVGATLTGTANGSLGSVGGYTPANGDRIIIKDQVNAAQNGIYVVTSTGSAGSQYVLTRATDFDNSPVGEIVGGAFAYVQNGSLAGTQLVVTTPTAITVGTTGITFSQLSGSTTLTAGSGISISGTTISNSGVITVAGRSGAVALSTSDISGLAVVASTGSYSSLIGTPSLATVATSGSYNDLSNKPTSFANITGGASGSIPYQTNSSTTALLAKGTDGQVLTLASGLPAWSTLTTSGSALTGTSLASNIVTSSLTSVGTLTSLTVTNPIIGSVTGNAATATSATTATNLGGGSAYAVPYQSTAGTTLFLPAGTSGQVLSTQGTGSAPIWTSAQNLISYPANQIVYGTGTGSSSYSSLTYNPLTNVLTVGGAGTALMQAGASQSIELLSDTSIILTVGSTDFLVVDTVGTFKVNGSKGTAGQVLTSNGSAAAASWSSFSASSLSGTSLPATIVSSSLTSVGTLGNLTVTGTISGSISGNAATATLATTATNIAGGAAGSIAYQTSSGATTMLAKGTDGQVLTLAGGVPTWASGGSGGISASSNNTFTAAQRGAVSVLTAGSTVTPNFDASNNFSLTATSSFTLANPTGTITPGQSGIIAISQDASGGRVITWGSYWKGAGGVKPTLSTSSNAVDLISYYVVSATSIFVSANLAIA
jgi:hypothetical protein